MKLPDYFSNRHNIKTHKTEGAEICDGLGKKFNRNCFWLMYRYLPDRLRRAEKAFDVCETLPEGAESRWKYFLGILKNTI